MALLAVDIGGTKSLAALIGPTDPATGATALLDSVTLPTDPVGGPDQWLDNLACAVTGWKGCYDGLAVTVTGLVSDGYWSALNAATLDFAGQYPLAERIESLFGHRPVLANDAQAAAYGEFSQGAGQGEDMVFLTVSTGLGGGIVSNGDLLRGTNGLAGHYGQTRLGDGTRFEDEVSGRAIERKARAQGYALTVPEIFAAAGHGSVWAENLIDSSALGIAVLCADIQLTLDPARIVIGGGIGLAPGYFNRVSNHLEHLCPVYLPALCPAALGANAGVLGIAALYRKIINREY